MVRFPVAVVFSLVASPLFCQGNGLEVRPDPKNVVAGALVGAWRLDESLNERLGHRGGQPMLEFREDTKVLAKVPAGIAEKLADHRIYLAGTMKKGNNEHAFLLTVRSGNPTVVWFRERNGDPLGDAETWNVTIVRAEARQEDMLFVGGDHNNQSLAAYTRDGAVVGDLEPAAAVTDMLQLIDAGRLHEFVDTYIAPEDLGKMQEAGRTTRQIAKQLEGPRLEKLRAVLTAIAKVDPRMTEDGDIAIWAVEQSPGRVRLQRIDGRWYLRNR